MLIYVVFGITGEYSDRREWTVKAFVDKAKAQDLVVKATEAAEVVFGSRASQYRLGSMDKNEYDPNMQMDYTGTSYYYVSVDCEV